MVIVFTYKGNINSQSLREEIIKRYNIITQSATYVRLFYENHIPYLTEGKEISITHTNTPKGERIELVAIGDKPIGVDIERKDRQLKVDVADRYFKEDEIRYIDNDNAKFMKIWTRKEAYGKSLKVGIYKDSVIGIDGFRDCDIFDGYQVTLYTTEKDIFFVAI